MKIAVVHDWIVDIAGSERVLREILRIFPDADVFTMFYRKSSLDRLGIPHYRVNASYLQRIPGIQRFYRKLLPLFPHAIESLDVTGYDLVISSSHSVAKNILTSSEQLHISYVHTPMRYAWDMFHEYMKQVNPLLRHWASRELHRIRIWDATGAMRVDHFVSNSGYVARRIEKVYRRKATVIYPPVDVDKFPLEKQKEDYYIAVSRLVPYKRMDIIVQAFTRMPSRRLIVAGGGPQLREIKRIAKGHPNIEVLGYVPDEELVRLIQKARALIFAAKEDFGIVPVEAQAAGTPVIAYGRGGAMESVEKNRTGIFFYYQTPEAIAQAVEEFEKLSFDPEYISRHARRFSAERFRSQFEQLVREKFAEFSKSGPL